MKRRQKTYTMADNIFRISIRPLIAVMLLFLVIQIVQGTAFGKRITNFVNKELIPTGKAMVGRFETAQEDALITLTDQKADKISNTFDKADMILDGVIAILEQTLPTDLGDESGEIRIHQPGSKAKKGEISSYYMMGEDCDPDSPEVQADLALFSKMSLLTEKYASNMPELLDISVYTRNHIIMHTNTFERDVAERQSEQEELLEKEFQTYDSGMGNDYRMMIPQYRVPFAPEDGVLYLMPFYKDKKHYGLVTVCIKQSFFTSALSEGMISRQDICSVFYPGSSSVIFSTDKKGIFQAYDIENETNPDNNPNASYITKRDPNLGKQLKNTFEKNEQGKLSITLKEPISDSYKADLYYSSITDTEWIVAIIRPESVTKNVTENFRKQLNFLSSTGNALIERFLVNVLIATILFMVIGSVLSYILSRRYSRRLAEPIRILSEKVKQLRGENMEFVWDREVVDEETEVLAEAFSEMTKRISSDIAQIKEYTAKEERISAELSLASEIQRGILPDASLDQEDQNKFLIRAFMEPAREVGGDLYDFLMIDEDHLGFVIGDVSGKGVPAALFMTVTKNLLRYELKENSYTPDKILERVNEALAEGNSMMMFVTVWVGVLELSTGRLISANGGHDRPVLRRSGGEFVLIQEENSVPLGIMENAEYPLNEITLDSGDVLFLYTDGVPEAVNTEDVMFEEQGMIDALNKTAEDSTPQEIEEHMVKSIEEFVGDAEQFDDITMVCLKIR